MEITIMKELNLDDIDPEEILPHIRDAFDLASDQSVGTWVTEGGRRIAAIVTVDEAEYIQHRLARILATPIPVMTPKLEARFEAWLAEHSDD
jgi:hypothetical protein